MSLEILSKPSQNTDNSLQASAQLKQRINRLKIIENEIIAEVDNINTKKERFREWTRSLGDNARIQELFSNFEDELTKLYSKINNLNKLRQKLLQQSGQLLLQTDAHSTALSNALKSLQLDDNMDKKAIVKSQYTSLDIAKDTWKSEGIKKTKTKQTESEEPINGTKKSEKVVFLESSDGILQEKTRSKKQAKPDISTQKKNDESAKKAYAAHKEQTKLILNQFMNRKITGKISDPENFAHKETDAHLKKQKHEKIISSKLSNNVLCQNRDNGLKNQADMAHPPEAALVSSESKKNNNKSTAAKGKIKKKDEKDSPTTIQKLKLLFYHKKSKKPRKTPGVKEQEKKVENPVKQKIIPETKPKAVKKDTRKKVIDNSILYLGIDIGTSQTTIAASNEVCETILSVVGRPKDIISQKLLKKDILFGIDALKNKLSLNLYKPLEKGVIKATDTDFESAGALIKHAISLVNPGKYKKIYAVIGAPALLNFTNQQTLIDAAREAVDAVMIVSEPFAVAYGARNIYNSLIVDIGAGTTDICSLKGTMPQDEDQITLFKAGDHIDMKLVELIKNKIQGVQITKDMAKKWKEQFSFTIESAQPSTVEIAIGGKPARIDISHNIKESCESIVPEIAVCIKKLISRFDPEFQNELKQNIVLAGGSSQIRNIDKYFKNQLRSLGEIKISLIPDPIVAGAKGALALAKDMTDDYWQGL